MDQSRTERANSPTRTDPVARWMFFIALLLIVVLLGTALAIVVYLSEANRAPRTVVERDVDVWETAVAETPKDVTAWSQLVYAYAEAGSVERALSAAERGKAATGSGLVALPEADVYRAAGRYIDALAAYDEAEIAAKEAATKTAEELRELHIYDLKNEATLASIYMGRGLSKRELGDEPGAITDLEAAVKMSPHDASGLVALADMYAKTGRIQEAEQRYREALTYVPDYAPALDGLDALREERP